MSAIIGLVSFATFVLLAFGLRTLIMWRQTGASGWKGFSERVGSAGWWGGVFFAIALVLGAAAPVLAVIGVLPVPSHSAQIALGTAITALGIAGTMYAQLAMGRSWRIGVDESERTQLVVGGPFRWVRNPIFTFILLTAAGLLVLVPNVLALASFAGLLLGVELQVRHVEEPYLRRTHGAAYARYAAQVGRFVPGLGRLRA